MPYEQWYPGTAIAELRSREVILQNAATANGNGIEIDLSGFGSLLIEVSGTFSAKVNFEATVGGSTWFALLMQNVSSGNQMASTTVPGLFAASINGLTKFRARISDYVSGSVTVIARALVFPFAAQPTSVVSATVDNVKITDPGGVNKLAVDSTGAASVTLSGSFAKGGIGVFRTMRLQTMLGNIAASTTETVLDTGVGVASEIIQLDMNTDYSNLALGVYLYDSSGVNSPIASLAGTSWEFPRPSSTSVKLSRFWKASTGTGQDANWISLQVPILAPNGFKVVLQNQDTVSHAVSAQLLYRRLT